jgi:methylase of polypeptide subunit release factors
MSGPGEFEPLALERLLRRLAHEGYRFTTPTPATHRRVLSRRGTAEAGNLRDVFGWSLPFTPELLDAEYRDCLEAAGALEPAPEGRLRSTVRVASVDDDLFVHSAFPPGKDAVFFGPDSYRFAGFLRAQLRDAAPGGTLTDVGAGAGVGALVAQRVCSFDRLILTDSNPKALTCARANLGHAGVRHAEFRLTQDLDGVEPPLDVVVANPPFIADEAAFLYRDGGERLGASVSLRWAEAASARLSGDGRALFYTGSAIVNGRDGLREALERLIDATHFVLSYQELDPDIFGEQLDSAAYQDVERIAAVTIRIERRHASQSREALKSTKRFFELAVAGRAQG